MAEQESATVRSVAIRDQIIQTGITNQVRDRMGGLVRELGELTKYMAPEDVTEARLMLLECIRNGFGTFYLAEFWGTATCPTFFYI